jgi:hypothetical protein
MVLACVEMVVSPQNTDAMISDDEKAKLRFELANANLQSIGRAQGLYVTALLTYICIVWGLFFVGSNEVSVHLGWLDLKVDGVWRITPFVLLVLTLAYIGTVTAAVPAFTQLRKAENELFGSRDHSFFGFDTHKNLLDYFAVLQFLPWGKTRKREDDTGSEPILHRLHHLILPALFLSSWSTSYLAIHELANIRPLHRASLIVGWCCFGLQIAFSLRPLCRCLGRFFGAKGKSDVYN